MLVLRYFLYVGGALLALLLVCAAVLPKPAVTDDNVASASDVPAIRINSQQKWPERVVLDTNAKMPASASVAQAAVPVATQAAAAKADVREAFAEASTDATRDQIVKEQIAAEVKKPEPKPPVRRKVARVRQTPQPYGQGYQPYPPPGYYGYSRYPQGRMQVAQQPRFGFFW